MHEPLLDRLEDYLEDKGQSIEVDRHLAECQECRQELASMKAQAALLRSLRLKQEAEPRAGFYGRVLQRIEAEGKPSLWALFGESLFAKRLAYASVTFLVLLGTFFVTTQDETTTDDLQPTAMLVEETRDPVTAKNPARDRDVVLVNLATYQD
ncbi:MAG TPA: hypothetical protein VE621_18925 [Bryobacteraceae bacterium]|jgi:anti-sigma factor RsiW|nr:hypothetical protein [Bryobacteraceae bacterium]